MKKFTNIIRDITGQNRLTEKQVDRVNQLDIRFSTTKKDYLNSPARQFNEKRFTPIQQKPKNLIDKDNREIFYNMIDHYPNSIRVMEKVDKKKPIEVYITGKGIARHKGYYTDGLYAWDNKGTLAMLNIMNRPQISGHTLFHEMRHAQQNRGMAPVHIHTTHGRYDVIRSKVSDKEYDKWKKQPEEKDAEKYAHRQLKIGARQAVPPHKDQIIHEKDRIRYVINMDDGRQIDLRRPHKIGKDKTSKGMAVFNPTQEKEINSIDWTKDQKGKELGKGHFGKVFEVKDNPKYTLKVSHDDLAQAGHPVEWWTGANAKIPPGKLSSTDREYYKYNKFKDLDLVAPTIKTPQGLVREKMRVVTRGTTPEDNIRELKNATIVPGDTKLTDIQVKQLISGVNQLSSRGVVVGDALQIGIGTDDKPYIYDQGELYEPNSPGQKYREDWEIRDENDEHKLRFLETIGKTEHYDRDHKKEFKDAMHTLNSDNTSHDDNQVYLDPNRAPRRKLAITPFNEKGLQYAIEINKKEHGLWMMPTIFPKATFIGRLSIDDRPAHIKYLANVLEHEEIHTALQKVGQPRDKMVLSDATRKFDNIVVPSVPSTDHTQKIELLEPYNILPYRTPLNPYSAQNINPALTKKLGRRDWDEDKELIVNEERQAKTDYTSQNLSVSSKRAVSAYLKYLDKNLEENREKRALARRRPPALIPLQKPPALIPLQKPPALNPLQKPPALNPLQKETLKFQEERKRREYIEEAKRQTREQALQPGNPILEQTLNNPTGLELANKIVRESEAIKFARRQQAIRVQILARQKKYEELENNYEG